MSLSKRDAEQNGSHPDDFFFNPYSRAVIEVLAHSLFNIS